jgi:hypothetical protein
MNRGAVETRLAIDRRGLSINQAAKLVKADGGTFSKILREEDGRKPGRSLSARILAEFGVAPTLWDQETEVQASDPDAAAHDHHPTGTEQ